MATCPACGGFLHENHRCWGRWRRRLRLTMWGVVGAIAGFIVVAVIVEQPAPEVSLVGAVLGAILATAITRSVAF